jgi:predicted dehydrogenase
MKTLRVGMIGSGFMGRAHSNALHSANMFMNMGVKLEPTIVSGLPKAEVKSFAKQFGWLEATDNWKDIVKRDDIDIVFVLTPGNLHCENVVAACNAGKHVICEKPLANTVAEAQKMVAAAKKNKVINMIGFTYRRLAAVNLAKKMIEKGKLGEIYHYRGLYLQDWIADPEFPLVWRLQKKLTGSGALGDIGAHTMDMAENLLGPITEVCGMVKTFITERPLMAESTGLSAKGAKKKGKVTVDDAAIIIGKFKNGALGTWEASRFAVGNRNGHTFEINGSKGSLKFDLQDLNRLHYWDNTKPQAEQGWTNILVTEPVHEYVNNWWPPGHIIGWEHSFVHQLADFVKCVVKKKPATPDFAHGLHNQKLLDGVLTSSKTKRWVRIR